LASREVNAYDFDNTIFRGDSTARFLAFLLRRRPALARYVFVWAAAAAKYALRLTDKTRMKQKIYSVFARVDDMDALVAEFWKKNAPRVKDFYLEKRRGDDIVISASPEFLLRDICADLGVGLLIASRVDPQTGGYDGLNCHGKEKVRRLREIDPDVEIGEFYSDSHSDEPMARIARKAFLVKGDKILDWQ
jgi:HAD superfamily phosphoserine phosphatase-like hydrolase